MRKILAIAAVFWLVPFSALAQPELDIAFKGGPNASTLAEDYRVKTYGFTGGLAGHLQWLLAERFLLGGQVEILYSPRGAEVVFEGEYLGKSREHYVDVTVAGRPGARLGPASVYVLLGGGVNLLLSANEEDRSGVKEDTTDGLRRIDVALLIGAGVAFQLPQRAVGPVRLGTVFLEARHDRGLIDTDPVVGGFRNRTSSLMVGLSFVRGTATAPPKP